MQKRLVDLTKSDSLNDSDYLFINHDDNPIQVSFPYFKQNVAPVDATLTEEGKAADAKATGDKINEINTNIETINTEIEGVKTNYATKEELSEVSTNLTETQEDVSELSTSIENVKANYLTKSDAQDVYLTKEDASTISDKEFYEGRKYEGMAYTGKTSDKGIKLHSVKGKTSQKTTNGYQLFDASKLPTKTIGGATLTNNGDGSFTISGSGNLSANFNYYYYMGRNPLKVGRLTLKLNGPNSIVPLMQVIGLNKLGDGSNQNRVWDIVNEASIDITQELLEQTKDIYIVFYGNQGKEIKPGTIKPMLYQDGDGTWEQYTGGKPAPNPDYDMPIENVEISKIISHGRQLFDSSKLATKSQGGATVTNNNDGSFTVSGSGNLSATFSSIYSYTKETYPFLKPGMLYASVKEKTVPSFAFRAKDENQDIVFTLYLNDENNKSVELTQDMINKIKTIEILFYAYKSAGSEIPIVSGNVKPMVYQDGDGTWEEFHGNTIETSLTLAQDDMYQNGTITRARKQVVFDGSSDETWTASSNPNTFYTMLSDKSIAETNEIKSNRFVQIEKATAVSNLENGQLKEDGNNPNIVYFKVNGVNDLSSFKTWLSTHNLIVEYELATPTTEEVNVPTIPSYYPYTNVSTDNDLTTDITWKILADCDNSLKQEELEKRILALETKAIE